MSVTEIISIGIAVLGLLITIIAIAVKQGSRISVLENEVERLDNDFKLHQALNETTFSKLETELKHISELLHKLLGYFEAKKDGIWDK